MNKNIKEFLQTIQKLNSEGKKVNHYIYDFEAVLNDKEEGQTLPVIVSIIMSPRGSYGKSSQAKLIALRNYRKTGGKTMWIKNDVDTIKKEKVSHLTKMYQHYSQDFDINGNMGIKNGLVYENLKEDKWYTKFVCLSQASKEKGSRDDYEIIIWDEFNENDKMVKFNKTKLLFNLIGTATDEINQFNPKSNKLKKIIILANFETLADQLFTDLGIISLTDEKGNFQEVYNIMTLDNRVLGRVLCPHFNKQQKENFDKDNYNNPIYQLAKKVGLADNQYFGENQWDDIHFVNEGLVPTAIEMLNQGAKKFVFKILSKYYYFIYFYSETYEKDIVYVMECPSNFKKNDYNDWIWLLNSRDKVENTQYNGHIKRVVLNDLGNAKMYFASFKDRLYVLERLVK